MLLEQFLHETRYLSIVHLSFGEEKLTIFNRAKKEHPNFHSFDLNNDIKSTPMADIFFIEIGETTKEKLKLLLGLFAKHKPIITYLFADDVENRLLLKFALHFGITNVLPLKNEENLLFSVFSKNANKLDDKLYTFQKIELEKKIEHFFPFLVFQGETLTYANAKAKMLYETNDLNALQAKINRDEELCEALKENEDAQGSIVIETASSQKEVYLCVIKSFPQSNEKIVTLIQYDPESESKNCSTILNRFDFVDKLKDRLAQQSVTHAAISLIFINISNLDKLSKTFKSTTLYDAFKNLVNKIFQFKDETQDVIQWSPNLYILMGEENNFEHACEQTKHLQQELVHATASKK